MEEFNWSFSKRERIGIFGIALIIISSFLFSHFLKPTPTLDISTLSKFETAVSMALKSEAEVLAEKNKKYQTKYPPKQKTFNKKKAIVKNEPAKNEIKKSEIVLENFNPNTADKNALIKLGIPERTANTIINFRAKGGKFFKAEDLKVVYGLSTQLYETLLPYVTIPKTSPAPKVVQVKSVKKLDLNLCTQEELMELRGIGPKLSKRIISFREALGGFYATEQLQEVYQLPDSTFNSIEPHLFFTPIIKKANINDLEIPKLVRHPYLSQALAGAIISLKDHEGKFENWELIEKKIKITTKELDNIKQYFDIY